MVLNFYGSVQSAKFLMVDNYSMDECLDSFEHLVFYQVSGEPRIAGYRGYAMGVASRLATVIYVAMVMPILYDNSYGPNNSKVATHHRTQYLSPKV